VKGFKSLSVMIVLLVLTVMGLAACGDSPTATPVPPTATVAPPATATTAAETLPTATKAVAAAPTATSALSVVATSTTAAGSRNATDDEVQLIKDATTSAQALQTYHFQIQIKPSTYITQPVQAEGDYEAPNMVHITGTMGDQSFEEVVIGTTVFKKDASGNYVKQTPVDTSSDPLASFSPESMVSGGNPLGSLGDLTSGIKNFKYAGDVPVQGVTTKHFTFSLDMADLMQGQDTGGLDLSDLNLGGGGLYIDPSKKVLYGIEYNLDLGAIFELMARAFSAFGGTPTPGGVSATPIPKLEVDLQALFTRQNDPSIKVPVTDEMKAEAGAGDATPTEVPLGDTTPTDQSTPDVSLTPAAQATVGSDTVAPVAGQVGQPANIKWATFTLNSVRREDTGNLDPAAGNEYVIVNLTIENTNGTDANDAAISSLLMLQLADASGKSMQWAPGAKADPLLDTVFQDTMKGQNLKKGEKITGEVGYEVPKGTTGLVLKFKPDPLLDEKAVLEVSLDQ
jgi:hypothetical protein